MSKEHKAKLSFYGGVKSVTGANFLLEHGEIKIIVDAGLIQEERFCEKKNCFDFPYDPKEADFVLVTHAHMDHIGRIPRLVKLGFSGTIYSTPATREIADIMLRDGLQFVLSDAEELGVRPPYTEEDIDKSLSLWRTVEYHEPVELSPNIAMNLKDAGHILGSAMIELVIQYEDEKRKIVFTGDLGNSPAPFLPDTEEIKGADYIVMESVYGDRSHEDVEERKRKLKEAVLDTVKKKGTLIVPAFSVSRTQVLLFELNGLIENDLVPSIPVFLDSPLAIKVTGIFRRYTTSFKEKAKELIRSGDDVFDFPRLKFTMRRDESMDIWGTPGAKIIIAGSGMSTGGRVIHHEKKYLSDPKNTLLIVGYQVPGSLGRRIQDGAKEVNIAGKKINVRADIRTITGYSGHRDSEDLVNFLKPSMETIRKAYVVMGEPKAALFLVQRIRDYLGVDAVYPDEGSTHLLE